MRDPFRWLLAALLVALGAALGWGVRQHRELIRGRLAAAADRQASARLEYRLTEAENARLAAEGRLRAQIELNARTMFPESRPVAASAAIDQFNAAVDRDPVWEAFYRQVERRRILARYNILFAALKIPPEKLAPLEDLLVERAITRQDTVHRQREAGRAFNSLEALAAVGRATDEVDARIEQLVGGDLAQKLKEWNGAVYSYGNAPNGPVAQDAVTLNEAGFALSADQLAKLALIRYEVDVLNPEARAEAADSQIDPQTGLTRLDQQLLAREAEVLSPEEIAVLRHWATEECRAKAAVDALRAKFHLEADQPAR